MENSFNKMPTKNTSFVLPKDLLILLISFCALSLFRIIFFKSDYFVFLFWNLFLAIIPFVISTLFIYFIKGRRPNTLVFLLVGIFWILLLPNAPYVVTDLIHIGKFHGAPIIFDSFLLFTFSWLGMVIFSHSLSHMDTLIKENYGKLMVNIKIPSIILLTSIGVYIGRYMRFNSWDVVANPSFFGNTFTRFMHPVHINEATMFVVPFAVFLFLSYLAWKNR